MSIFSDISDIPLRVRFNFSGKKEQYQTFEAFREAQRENPKNLVLIKAKDRPFHYDDVLVRLKGVPRYYPDNEDNSNPSKTENEKEEPFSFVKPDIKIVGKIEPHELELLKQKENQIKLSNEQLKEQAKVAKKQAEEQAKAAKIKAKERVKSARKLAKEQAKAARKLEKEKAKAAKEEKKQAEKQLQNPEKISNPKKKPKKEKFIVEKVQPQEDVQSENLTIIDDTVVNTIAERSRNMVAEQSRSVEPDLQASQEIPEKKSKKKPTTFQSFMKKFKKERQVKLEYPLQVAYVRPDDKKYRVDDVLVKMPNVRRFYPNDFDKSKQPLSPEQLDDVGSYLKPDIKIVNKIELDTLNEKTRPNKKSKKQLDKDRKERAFQSGKKTKKQLAQERNERLQLSKEQNAN